MYGHVIVKCTRSSFAQQQISWMNLRLTSQVVMSVDFDKFYILLEFLQTALFTSRTDSASI